MNELISVPLGAQNSSRIVNLPMKEKFRVYSTLKCISGVYKSNVIVLELVVAGYGLAVHCHKHLNACIGLMVFFRVLGVYVQCY